MNDIWNISATKRDKSTLKCFANRYKIYIRNVKDPISIISTEKSNIKHVIWIKSAVNFFILISAALIAALLTYGQSPVTEAAIKKEEILWLSLLIFILFAVVWNLLFNLFWKIKISAWKNKDIP